MSTSARSAAPLFVAVTAAAAWGIVIANAAPAVAAPGDSTDTSPINGNSTVLPVTSTIENIWNAYVPPNLVVPPSTPGTFDRLAEQFIPTTTEIRDFSGFVQQFRPSAPITPPAG